MNDRQPNLDIDKKALVSDAVNTSDFLAKLNDQVGDTISPNTLKQISEVVKRESELELAKSAFEKARIIAKEIAQDLRNNSGKYIGLDEYNISDDKNAIIKRFEDICKVVIPRQYRIKYGNKIFKGKIYDDWKILAVDLADIKIVGKIYKRTSKTRLKEVEDKLTETLLPFFKAFEKSEKIEVFNPRYAYYRRYKDSDFEDLRKKAEEEMSKERGIIRKADFMESVSSMNVKVIYANGQEIESLDRINIIQ